MGISHQAIVNAHPDVNLVAVCDPTDYIRDGVAKFTGVKGYASFNQLLVSEELDAIFIATPSRMHPEMVRHSLEKGWHVFCEKPFCLDAGEGLELAQFAESKGLVTQVGYHYRFVEPFNQLREILENKELGELHHIRVEAYGPVVLQPKGSTWRSSKSEGGGCLYDYASHAIDLVNFLVGPPISVSGSVLNQVFSRDVDDEVYATLHFADGFTGQLAANWSDESYRKMSMKVSVWGKHGRAVADRQELQVYRRPGSVRTITPGWSVKYAPELAEDVWYYLRGEEYSSQIDHFVQAIKAKRTDTRSTFRSATATDAVIASIIRDAEARPTSVVTASDAPQKPLKSKGLFASLMGKH
jgi:predicted dehydrogenase